MTKNWKAEAEYYEKKYYRELHKFPRGGIIFIALMAILLVGILTWLITTDVGIDISHATADDICRQLTGNESAIAIDSFNDRDIGRGKMVCELPSDDSTQNIIMRYNND